MRRIGFWGIVAGWFVAWGCCGAVSDPVFRAAEHRGAWQAYCAPWTSMNIDFPDEDRSWMRMAYENGASAEAQLWLDRLPQGTFPTNWASYKAIVLRAYSDRCDAALRLRVVDAKGVAYVARQRVASGWSDQVEFLLSDFVPFPYSQQKGTMDWHRIAALYIESSDYDQRGVLGVETIRLAATVQPRKAERRSPIRLNQLGYYPSSPKVALVADMNATGFEVVAMDGSLALKGGLKAVGSWSLSGEQLHQADFSALTVCGHYRLRVMGEGGVAVLSEPFEIRGGLYRDLLPAAVKSYTFQRCSTALEERHFGVYARPLSHSDTACRRWPSTGAEGVVDVAGGWYDAGDYGKYSVNAGITLGTLLLTQELYPAAVSDGACDIPESGNGRSDLLDEIFWELDWLERMQDPADGGVYFKVCSKEWDGFVAPEHTHHERVVVGKSTTSALNFAAVMAKASTMDLPKSRHYLKSAERAWVWAMKHPDVGHPTEYVGAGLYDDTHFADEFLWASTELALATGKASYWQEVEQRIKELPMYEGASWQEVRNMAYIALVLSKRMVPEAIRTKAYHSVLAVAQLHYEAMQRIPYRIPMEAFAWGSNGDLLNRAIPMLVAYRLTGEQRWLHAVAESTDYLLGKNACAFSFITGFGHRSPHNLHHRIMLGYRYEEPFPGLLVGGPNSWIEDDYRKKITGVLYPDVPPAKQYLDHRDSAATNETCINWNAPLVFILAFLEHEFAAMDSKLLSDR